MSEEPLRGPRALLSQDCKLFVKVFGDEDNASMFHDRVTEVFETEDIWLEDEGTLPSSPTTIINNNRIDLAQIYRFRKKYSDKTEYDMDEVELHIEPGIHPADQFPGEGNKLKFHEEVVVEVMIGEDMTYANMEMFAQDCKVNVPRFRGYELKGGNENMRSILFETTNNDLTNAALIRMREAFTEEGNNAGRTVKPEDVVISCGMREL